MKRFLLFDGAEYYPFGGWHDFVSAHDTASEAVAQGKERKSNHYLNWFHVVDSETGEIVAELEH